MLSYGKCIQVRMVCIFDVIKIDIYHIAKSLDILIDVGYLEFPNFGTGLCFMLFSFFWLYPGVVPNQKADLGPHRVRFRGRKSLSLPAEGQAHVSNGHIYRRALGQGATEAKISTRSFFPKKYDQIFKKISSPNLFIENVQQQNHNKSPY